MFFVAYQFYFIFKYVFQMSFKDTILRVPNSLDPDACHFLPPDLGSSCMQSYPVCSYSIMIKYYMDGKFYLAQNGKGSTL